MRIRWTAPFSLFCFVRQGLAQCAPTNGDSDNDSAEPIMYLVPALQLSPQRRKADLVAVTVLCLRVSGRVRKDAGAHQAQSCRTCRRLGSSVQGASFGLHFLSVYCVCKQISACGRPCSILFEFFVNLGSRSPRGEVVRCRRGARAALACVRCQCCHGRGRV